MREGSIPKRWKTIADNLSRMELARQIMFLSIEHGWEPGKGPGGVAYSNLSEEVWELLLK